MKSGFIIHLRHRFQSGFQLNVDWTTESQHVGITGPSGSGKTSILHAVAGIFQPQDVHIEVNGNVLACATQWLPPRSRKIGLVTQDALLYPHLNVVENLRFGMDTNGPISAIDSMVEMLEIDGLMNRRTRHLSGGERQRVALGRALLSNPSTLLLDEPFSAIDPTQRMRVINKVAAHLTEANISMLLVSHDHAVIESLCSLSFPMSQGSGL